MVECIFLFNGPVHGKARLASARSCSSLNPRRLENQISQTDRSVRVPSTGSSSDPQATLVLLQLRGLGSRSRTASSGAPPLARFHSHTAVHPPLHPTLRCIQRGIRFGFVHGLDAVSMSKPANQDRSRPDRARQISCALQTHGRTLSRYDLILHHRVPPRRLAIGCYRQNRTQRISCNPDTDAVFGALLSLVLDRKCGEALARVRLAFILVRY